MPTRSSAIQARNIDTGGAVAVSLGSQLAARLDDGLGHRAVAAVVLPVLNLGHEVHALQHAAEHDVLRREGTCRQGRR